MHSGWTGGKGFGSENSDVFAELAEEYARATAEEQVLQAVLHVARQFGVSPCDVLEWEWAMFTAAVEVLREEAEGVRRAVRRR